MDALCDVLKTMRSQPEIRMVRDFHNEDAYIEALAKSISDFWKNILLGEKAKSCPQLSRHASKAM